jgi:hypothetical protein
MRSCTPSFEEHADERTRDGDSDEGRGKTVGVLVRDRVVVRRRGVRGTRIS